jgi:hypothetical protein
VAKPSPHSALLRTTRAENGAFMLGRLRRRTIDRRSALTWRQDNRGQAAPFRAVETWSGSRRPSLGIAYRGAPTSRERHEQCHGADSDDPRFPPAREVVTADGAAHRKRGLPQLTPGTRCRHRERSVLVRIDLVRPRHHHDQRGEDVLDGDGGALRVQHLLESAVRLRRLVQAPPRSPTPFFSSQSCSICGEMRPCFFTSPRRVRLPAASVRLITRPAPCTVLKSADSCSLASSLSGPPRSGRTTREKQNLTRMLEKPSPNNRERVASIRAG